MMTPTDFQALAGRPWVSTFSQIESVFNKIWESYTDINTDIKMCKSTICHIF
jgi:hypothetical protein